MILSEIEIFNRVKNNEIASILNITPETLSRILSRLKKEKIIDMKDHTVIIRDMESLHMILEKNTLKVCSDCFSKKRR